MINCKPKATAFEAIDRNKDEIAKVGDAIFSYAELGMQEVETSRYLTAQLEKFGFKVVTPRAAPARGGHVALAHPEAWRICQALKAAGAAAGFFACAA